MRWRLFRRNHAPDQRTVTEVGLVDVAEAAVLVVAPDRVTQLVREVVPGAAVTGVATLAGLWRGIAARQLDEAPALVVLSLPAGESADALAEAIAFCAPHSAVVVLHPRADLEDLGERYQRVVAEHPDVCDVDAPVEVVHDVPVTGAAVAAAIRAVAPRGLRVRDCPPEFAGVILGSPTLVPVERPRPVGPVPARTRGMVVAVASAKGGAGKSTTAVALAGTLAASGERVCLVDLDLRDGQLATLLDVAMPSIASLARESAGITDATVLAHLAHNERLNVSALLAPARGDDPDVRDPMLHRHVLAVLRRHFDVIVLDCPVTYRDPLLAHTAFVEAERVIAVSTLAVTSLVGLRRMLHALTASPSAGGLGLPSRKFGVVVNGALNGVAVDRGQVDEHAGGLPVVAIVPHAARDALIATNRRRLDLLVAHPDLSPAYRELAAWCLTAASAAQPTKRPRRFGRRRVA
jgi:Mrp family chromosome partitioning ATPase